MEELSGTTEKCKHNLRAKEDTPCAHQSLDCGNKHEIPEAIHDRATSCPFSKNSEDLGQSSSSKGKELNYALQDMNIEWEEYLNKTSEERDHMEDPFLYKDRDLHLNHCLRVIPDSFKEEVKYANPFPSYEDQVYESSCKSESDKKQACAHEIPMKKNILENSRKFQQNTKENLRAPYTDEK
ncbi:uncharacterized protein LOC118182194 [Stegodyphus dumicola]|uniref:uncharacterized protein LOC118182194 n=1 Tax=Stegodyphus dumicola TaxID=202533 RepID=UPI0015AE0C35|nr:uncharacterized protein LOC118182194 [Stegodyphus dumicola]